MPRNAHRPGTSAAQSFNPDEIDILDRLMKTLLRGGTVTTMMRAPAFASLVKKTQAMKRSLARQRRKAGPS